MYKILFLLIIISSTANASSFKFGGLKLDVTTNTPNGGTTTLTASSTQVQTFVSSSSNQTLKLPAATTLVPGYWFGTSNEGSGTITVTDGANAVLSTVGASSSSVFMLTATGSTSGSWDVQKGAGSSSGGGLTKEYVFATYAAGTGTDFSNGGSTSYVDETSATVTFTNQKSSGFSSISTAASNVLGITLTALRAGPAYVSFCFTGFNTNPAGDPADFRLTDGTTVIGSSLTFTNNSTAFYIPECITGIYTFPDTSPHTLKIQGKLQGVNGTASVGTNTLNSAGTNAVMMTIFNLD